jgi:hypothetical protein
VVVVVVVVVQGDGSAVQAVAGPVALAAADGEPDVQWNSYKHRIFALPQCMQPWAGVAGMPGDGSAINGRAIRALRHAASSSRRRPLTSRVMLQDLDD